MPITLFYNVSDGNLPKPHISRVEIQIPTGTDLGETVLVMARIGNVIRALLTGQIVGAGFIVEVGASAFVSNPVAEVLSDVQEKALFTFRGVNDFPKTLTIPTFDETLFTDGGAGDAVDLTATPVVNFVEMMTTGIQAVPAVGAFIQPTDVRGDDLELLVSAVEAWGKSRR